MLIKQNTKRTGKTNGLDFHVSPRLQQATIVFFFYSRASKYVKNIYSPPHLTIFPAPSVRSRYTGASLLRGSRGRARAGRTRAQTGCRRYRSGWK